MGSEPYEYDRTDTLQCGEKKIKIDKLIKWPLGDVFSCCLAIFPSDFANLLVREGHVSKGLNNSRRTSQHCLELHKGCPPSTCAGCWHDRAAIIMTRERGAFHKDQRVPSCWLWQLLLSHLCDNRLLNPDPLRPKGNKVSVWSLVPQSQLVSKLCRTALKWSFGLLK